MNLKFVLVCFCAFILNIGYTAFAQDIFHGRSKPEKYMDGKLSSVQNISEKTVGGYPIVNLGSEFNYGYSKVYQSSNVRVDLGSLIIYSDVNKIHSLTLEVIANLEQGNMSDWLDEPCKRDDMLWKRSIGRSFRDVNCVTVNHFVGHFVNPTGEFQLILADLKGDGYQFAPTVIRVAFTRYMPGGRVLSYIVTINPELYGVRRESSTLWGTNGWHKNLINKDPEKLKLLEKIKTWSIDVQDKMDKAFGKDLDAFKNLKPIKSYLSGN